MPFIKVSTIVNASSDKVFKILKDVEYFPKFMREVQEVEVLKRSGKKIVTRWKVDIDGTPIEWVEEDVFDDKKMRWKFNSIEGDYQYKGVWTLEEVGKKATKVTIQVKFDWQAPNFEKLIGYVLEKKARGALRGMLNAIKKRVNTNG